MNAPTKPQKFEVDAWSKMRIHIAGQIAAGLASNPEELRITAYESEIARASVSIADHIISYVLFGHP